jgi:hypothetical protein
VVRMRILGMEAMGMDWGLGIGERWRSLDPFFFFLGGGGDS